MFKKPFTVICVAILSLFGLTWQEQVVVPNQEIVLQFNDKHAASVDARSTIASVKVQLERIGVKCIKIKTFQKGILKITYYSNADVKTIKRILQGNEAVRIAGELQHKNNKPAQLPSENNTLLSYNFDIYEIQNIPQISKGLNGTQQAKQDLKSHRFFDLSSNVFSNQPHAEFENVKARLAHTIYRNLAVAINHASKNTPEVRAGPIS